MKVTLLSHILVAIIPRKQPFCA